MIMVYYHAWIGLLKIALDFFKTNVYYEYLNISRVTLFFGPFKYSC
ncbi:MAG: hypothetical protein Ct9H300mP23_11520 [Nitrospinota bacterium]|nr:MAG: hypothetical protein Ct9H300mP23_11520 [Nitrospinota bacterium]